ncbi:MAG: hypothetical protein ABI723_06015 [Bacteroidia bacterium]
MENVIINYGGINFRVSGNETKTTKTIFVVEVQVQDLELPKIGIDKMRKLQFEVANIYTKAYDDCFNVASCLSPSYLKSIFHIYCK